MERELGRSRRVLAESSRQLEADAQRQLSGYARDLERVRSEAAELRVHADEGARAMQRTQAKVAELETTLHASEEARRRLEDAHR